MGGNYILDEQHEPQLEPDIAKWAQWFESADRIVSRTTIDDDVYVSTVFLGIDHRFDDDGPPILWETMVFGRPLDEECERYTSRMDALAGHAAMCQRVRATRTPETATDGDTRTM
jgi:hypothetical protein